MKVDAFKKFLGLKFVDERALELGQPGICALAANFGLT